MTHRPRLSGAVLALAATVAFTASARVDADEIPRNADAIRHALSRLTFGPRPGDVERVERVGLARWIDRQLNPTTIDDSALVARLPQPGPVPTSFASPREARRVARRALEDLAAARLTRAVYSERQLEEVLVDFWMNHFNVYARKGRTAIFVPSYERDAIRPHVLGRFRDLLGATARHPAMLFYLDNWMSVDPDAAIRFGARRPNAGGQQRRRGLNENYARELLELHTLGVDGGYTQQDVVEVARAFTGWTIAPPREAAQGGMAAPIGGGGFRFVRMLHDTDAKVVLRRTIRGGGGMEDGERVLDIVASHPSTARHIATKLARRFVSDDPPEALVVRAAARFRETDGNLREVVRTIITSAEFFASAARGAKVKTPLEFVVSAARAADLPQANTAAMARALGELGMPLYLCEPPTGYEDSAEAWVTPGALVARINAAQRIVGRQAAIVASPEFQRR